ncbi:MAG: anti-sigma factor antagonist [Syntrophus sp. (in: bacteria)]|nr:anti-sigma factor antagonist [Syntrophus sp. (in: bacteria)]
MNIQEKSVSGILVVTPLGKRIDASSSPELKSFMISRIDAGQTIILLDLSQVDFVDSSGLGAIVSALKALKGRGDFAISGLRETVRTIFHLTLMENIFKVFPSAEEALNVLGKRS